MDNALIMQIVVGLIAIFYLVASCFSAKTWQVVHVLLAAMVFVAAGVFCVFAAVTLKTHQQWREQYNQVRADLDRELADQVAMELGAADALELSEQTLRGVQNALSRATVDRGRLWRNLTVTAAQGDASSVTLSLVGWGEDRCRTVGVEAVEEEAPAPVEEPVAEPAAEEGQGEAPPAEGEEAPAEQPAGPGIKPHGLVENLIVYAFKEVPLSSLSEARQRVLFPDSELYLKDTQGLCRVPGAYLGEFKVTAVADTTVTLAPNLPLDPRQIADIQARGTTWVLYELMPLDAHELFAGLSDEQLQTMFPQAQLGLPAERYTALLSELRRDQQPADPDDPPERVWLKVKFVRAHKMDDVEFNAGDEVVLDGETAAKLIDSGVAERVEPIFVRGLRDYAYFYREVWNRFVELEDIMAVVARDMQTLGDSLAKVQKQIAEQTEIRDKLQADKQGFEVELRVVNQLLGTLEQQQSELRAALSEIYRTNNRLAAELAEIQRTLLLGAPREQEQARRPAPAQAAAQ
jgi:hypothetical protein